MKKLILALLATGLLVSVASADVTKLFKMSGATTVYVGSPQSGLPATAYVAIDEFGNGYCVFYWTKDGDKFMSTVLNFDVDISGALLNLQYDGISVYQNVKAADGVTVVQRKSAGWWLVGRGTGVGLVPDSLAGYIYSGVYDTVALDDLGFGEGSCRATAYKTFSGATDTALAVISAVASDLQAAGYTLKTSIKQ